MGHHIAQINIGRLVAPIGDPRVEEFVALLEPVNLVAESSPGFVWRLKTAEGDATSIAYDDDPLVIVNMSVWESIEALKEFVYRSPHTGVLRDRAKWFQPLGRPHTCLWWVAAGHFPDVSEGRGRLEHYERHGSTPLAFSFSEAYSAPG